VSPAFGQHARSLLAGDGDSPQDIALRAAQSLDRFGRHLSRLLGDAGIQVMQKRSIALVRARFPWLPAGTTPAGAGEALRLAMEEQDPESITEAFVAVLSAFVGLLERLIGEGLVERLLDEVWPAVFTSPTKDSL
jgi:hypothetical protein